MSRFIYRSNQGCGRTNVMFCVQAGQTFLSDKLCSRTNVLVGQNISLGKQLQNKCRSYKRRSHFRRSQKVRATLFLLRTLLVITYLILFQIGNSFVSKSGIFLALLPSNEFPSFNQHRKEQQKILTLRQNCFETFLKTTIQCFLDCILWPYH